MRRPWEKMEDTLARRLRGKRTPGSGNGRKKGDVVGGRLVIECKETSLPKMSVSMLWFTKLLREIPPGKIPVVALEFGDGNTLAFVPEEHLPSPSPLGNDFDWTGRRSITLTPGDLEAGDRVKLGQVFWAVITARDLKNLGEEPLLS